MPASRPARWLRVLAAATLGLASQLVPATASASCLAPPPGDDPWAAADAVFLGTVTSVANNARWATVRVEEIWAGPDQPAEVIVRGGPEGDASISVERTYDLGVRYVFALELLDGELSDSACSGTTEADTIDLAAARPPDARGPNGGHLDVAESPAGIDLGGLVGPVLLVAIVGGLLMVTVLVARRREL